MLRKTLFRKIAPFLAALSWTLPGWLAAERLPLKSYSTVDGLPSDRINCILRDSHGFLWFGTWDGISRFDGYRFENVTASDGLPAPTVDALLEAGDQTYWAATTGGLFHWNPTRTVAAPPGRSFEIVRFPEDGRSSEVRAILEDRTGSLWAGGVRGLFRVEKHEGRWAFREVPFRPAPKVFTDGVFALLQDRSGDLWIGCDTGLYRRSADGLVERVGRVTGPPSDVRSLLQDREGTIWVGTHTEGIFRLRRVEGGPGWIAAPFASQRTGLAGDFVIGLLQSFDGTVWAASFGGLTRFSARAEGSRAFRTYTSAEGLTATGIFSLGEDAAGNLWVGTDDAGVMRLARGGFETFDRRDGLASARIVAIFETRSGQPCVFAVGTQPEEIAAGTRFLACLETDRFVSIRPRFPAGTRQSWGWSQFSFQDRQGEWWIPTLSGIDRFPALPFSRLASTPPRHVYTTADGLPSDEVFRAYEDRHGDIWLSFLSSPARLARWNRSRDSVDVFSPSNGVPADPPTSFAEDASGSLWIGFYSGGLARYRDTRFSFFTDRQGLPAGRIRALYADRSGRLWVASSQGGIARIDHPDEAVPRFRRYTTKQGLSSDSVWSLAEDRWNRIYVGTERALDRLTPASGVIQRFTPDDGLVPGVIEEALEDSRGVLWFGSDQGISRFVPEPERPATPVPVRIARVLLGGKASPLPELGAVHLSLPDLTRQAGPLQIDYLGLAFAPGGRLRYQYRLDGADSRWGPPLEERSVIYAGLPAGRYRFRVRAVGNDGAVSPESADVSFRILPPLWQRPWLVAAAALGLIALAYAFHRARLRGALAVERIRTRIATDLHDDIGASLSQIAILSEIARQEPDDSMPRVREALSRIAGVSRDVVDSLGDTVWAIDPRRDRLQDLIQRMRRFAGDLLTERQIELRFEASADRADRDLPLDLRRQIFLIFKEAVHNVSRHSACTLAEIELRVDARNLCLRVRDNGIGFDPAAPKDGYGMSSMRARVESLRGSLEIDSRPEGASGTTIRVRLPLPR